MPSSDQIKWLSDRVDLERLGIRSWAELLADPGVQDAELLLTGTLSDPELQLICRNPEEVAKNNKRELISLDLKELKRLSPHLRRGLEVVLGIKTTGELCRACTIVRSATSFSQLPHTEVFSEKPSAPQDLIPKATGAIATTAKYTQFVRDKTVSLADIEVEIRVDEGLLRTVDPRLLAAFQFDPTPHLHLGYAAGYRQEWINLGTYLGEPLQSIGLAPGETRRIAIVDWQRTSATKRDEGSDISEAIENEVTHTRGLKELIRSTAEEVQTGKTSLIAGTIAASGAMVGSSGSTAGGSAAGMVSGALFSLAAGVASAVGGSAQTAGNAQLGSVVSETGGNREITSSFSQDINDTCSQKAASLRSLMSTIVLTGQEAERDSLMTQTIANHNHAHALTIQYFEVLQHYQLHTKLTRHEGLLFLPMQPIVFDAELVLSYWETLRRGFQTGLRMRFDRLISNVRKLSASPLLESDFDPESVEVSQIRIHGGGAGLIIKLWCPQHELDGTSLTRGGANDPYALDLSEQSFRLKRLKGLFVIDILPTYSFALDSGHELEATVFLKTTPETIIHTKIEVSNGYSDLKLMDVLQRAREDARRSADDSEALNELISTINRRPYGFTRLLVLSLEPEQLREVIESLILVDVTNNATSTSSRRGSRATGSIANPSSNTTRLSRSELVESVAINLLDYAAQDWLEAIRKKLNTVSRKGGIPLSYLVDSQPFGWSDGMLVMRMRSVDRQGSGALNSAPISKRMPQLASISEYPSDLHKDLLSIASQESKQSVFLPTGGHFAEAILGRSNSAERIDGTRHIFWHELPNPLVATEINPLSAGTRSQNTAPPTVTQFDPVLSQAAPTPLPDTSIGSEAMSIIGKADLFRDMSKAEELTSVLNNLSNLAGSMANQAGQLAGEAQSEALQKSGDLAGRVASTVERMMQLKSDGGLPVNATSTQRAVAGNRIEDLAAKPASNIARSESNGGEINVNDSIARAFGASTGKIESNTEARGFNLSSQGSRRDSGNITSNTLNSKYSTLRDSLSESLRASTDPGNRVNVLLKANPEAFVKHGETVITKAFIEELRPLLDKISDDDAILDRAMRLALDLQGNYELLGLDPEQGPLIKAAPYLAKGWRAARARAVTAIQSSGSLDSMKQLVELIGDGQLLSSTINLTDSETDLQVAQAEAGINLQIERIDHPLEVKENEMIEITVHTAIGISTNQLTSLPGAKLTIMSLESVENEIKKVAETDGTARFHITQDPLHLGEDSAGPRSPNGDMTIVVQAFHPDWPSIQCQSIATILGSLKCEVLSAVYEDDGSNALSGSTLISSTARRIFVRLALTSAGVPIRRAPINISVNGSASVENYTSRSGSDNLRGQISFTLVPGLAGTGDSIVIITADTPSGRSLSKRIDVRGA